MVSEPADLSNAEIATDLMLNGRSVAQSDSLGQLVYDMQPGSYELQMTPKASAPFLAFRGRGRSPEPPRARSKFEQVHRTGHTA